MFYLVDGYNLIFTALKNPTTLQSKRENATQILSDLLSKSRLALLIVFDGDRLADEESGYQYFDRFEAFFTPKGQSADDYLIEYVSLSKSSHQITVVSSDKGLCMQCKSLGAFIQSPKDFIRFLQKKAFKNASSQGKNDFVDTDIHIERLKKIFEKKLKESD